MADFPAEFELSTLGANGVVLTGQNASDLAGTSVASAGDLNGDGIDDFIIGATQNNPGSAPLAGAAYVVFGVSGGLPQTLSLGSLNGTNGFKLTGQFTAGYAGNAVASAGDVNGDGVDDLIIGASLANLPGGRGGAAYVVFGRQGGGFAASIDLASLDGTNGFRLPGEPGAYTLGVSVSAAGDINGDGIDDFAVSAPRANPNGNLSGATYVVFGTQAGFAADFDLSGLSGANGFRINGAAALDLSGSSISAAGDINGDGIGDLIIGARGADPGGVTNAGASYVVFGTRAGFAADVELAGLNGSNGFQILGESENASAGTSVARAGDINGDGIDDLIIGASATTIGGQTGAGAAYVVFGTRTGFAGAIDLSGLNGANGFQISGALAGDRLGSSVSGAGDINGDGIDDIVIGVSGADWNGDLAGGAYVIYGRTTGFAADIAASTINGTLGFRIDGPIAGGAAGTSVAAAGDVNGDGHDDLIIGAPLNGSGRAYIVYGRPAPGPITLYGTAGADTLTGEEFNDFLYGGDGADILSGMDGGDFLDGGTGADLMTGGAGDDVYAVDDPGDVIVELADGGADTVLASITYTLAANVESLSLRGAADINGTGNGLNNIIYGNDGANILDGAGGADRLFGGLGDDILIGGSGGDFLDGEDGADQMLGGVGDDLYLVRQAGDTVIELDGEGGDRVRTSISYTLSANVENLTLESWAGAIDGTGNAQANVIDGNGAMNSLAGGEGNDLIRGAGGDDTLNGDGGVDQLLGGDGSDYINGGADNDRLDGGAGADTLYGGAGLDILEGGADADFLFGDAGNDQLSGGDGTDELYGGADNDVLRGGSGQDTLYGGTGDDTYFVEDADILVESSNQGIDTVRASIGWTLGDHFERLVLEGSGNLNGTGNSLANVLTGNGGNNVLDGGAGADIINGGLGADTLIGGLGADIMTGGGGADTFVIRQESIYSSAVPAGRSLELDTVTDLIASQGDRLNLSAIDAIAGGADDAFTLVGAFSQEAGQMTLTFGGGVTTLSLDTDGDGRADYMMKITGDVRADSGGWLL